MTNAASITSPPPGDDADVVRRAQEGSPAAFTVLVDRYERRLYDFLLRRSGSPVLAEEAVQEAFVRAWTSIDRYRPRWAFSTWLYTIAARALATQQRTARRSAGPIASDPSTSDGDDPARRAARADEARHLWDLADRVLGREERAALWLRYAEDLGIRDIARVLGRPRVSVRVMLHRARETLARHADSEPAGARGPHRPPAPPRSTPQAPTSSTTGSMSQLIQPTQPIRPTRPTKSLAGGLP